MHALQLNEPEKEVCGAELTTTLSGFSRLIVG